MGGAAYAVDLGTNLMHDHSAGHVPTSFVAKPLSRFGDGLRVRASNAFGSRRTDVSLRRGIASSVQPAPPTRLDEAVRGHRPCPA